MNNKLVGPFSFTKILKLLEEGKLNVGQYIFDHETNSWALVGDIDIFNEFIPERPIIMPEIAKYYTYESLQTQGPFRKLEIIKKIDRQSLNVFDYIYADGDEVWTRLKDHSDFSNITRTIPGAKPAFKQAKSEATVTGFPVPTHIRDEDRSEMRLVKKWEKIRKFKRSPYSSPAQIQHNDQLFPGIITEIGAGGCFIEFKWKDLSKDDVVYIKIMPGIVPLKFECQARASTLVSAGKKGVGFEFIGLNKSDGLEIQKFVEKFAKKLGG